MAEEPVRVVAYDPAWPRRFEEERARLAGMLAPWLAGPIEHVGSTAVPGLAAKPVIDVMAGVASLEASRPAIEVLTRHGWCPPGTHPDVALEYARLKRELAARYRFGREAYTEAKGPFVERVVAAARGR